jgi:hypothetical protein
MADFDLTKVPELVAARLDAVAADVMTRGQQMFAQALEEQQKLLTALASPAAAIATATATRAQRLASGPPPASPSGTAPAGTAPADTTPADAGT